jgi:hypothetical protein
VLPAEGRQIFYHVLLADHELFGGAFMNHECSAESELNPGSSCHEEVHLKLNTMSSFAELCI